MPRPTRFSSNPALKVVISLIKDRRRVFIASEAFDFEGVTSERARKAMQDRWDDHNKLSYYNHVIAEFRRPWRKRGRTSLEAWVKECKRARRMPTLEVMYQGKVKSLRELYLRKAKLAIELDAAGFQVMNTD